MLINPHGNNVKNAFHAYCYWGNKNSQNSVGQPNSTYRRSFLMFYRNVELLKEATKIIRLEEVWSI